MDFSQPCFNLAGVEHLHNYALTSKLVTFTSKDFEVLRSRLASSHGKLHFLLCFFSESEYSLCHCDLDCGYLKRGAVCSRNSLSTQKSPYVLVYRSGRGSSPHRQTEDAGRGGEASPQSGILLHPSDSSMCCTKTHQKLQVFSV